jgi:hypothetical protein
LLLYRVRYHEWVDSPEARQFDFVGSFNRRVAELAVSGELENVNGIAKLNEVFEVECNGDADRFDVILFADFVQNDATSAIVDELQILSSLFGDTLTDFKINIATPSLEG